MEVFRVPVLDRFLVYVPLGGVLAVVDGDAIASFLAALGDDGTASRVGPALPRMGPVTDPQFLGIIPTRGCNMACPYCDFAAPKRDSPVMALSVAQRAVDAYVAILRRSAADRGRIQFFGGEPFFAPDVVRFVVEYARQTAQRLGMRMHIEASSNGMYDVATCEWIANHLDALVLSLDGPPEVLDRQRPGASGRGVSHVLVRSARILSEGTVELAIRACVTSDTVHRMPEIAHWLTSEFRPSAVCFEPVSLAHHVGRDGLVPPDPYEFATQFVAAEAILAGAGVRAVFSTAEIDTLTFSFCPVGHDALIVSPDGSVDACYLQERDWRSTGLDLRLGRLGDQGFDLDIDAVRRVRTLSVDNKPLCRDCLCRHHCAGGCHVNHDGRLASYDRLCVQTRIVTLYRLLGAAGEAALADRWLRDRSAVERSVYQAGDRLAEAGP